MGFVTLKSQGDPKWRVGTRMQGCGVWARRYNVGSHQRVFPANPWDRREKKENPGTCHHVEVGPMARMCSSSGSDMQ